MITSALVVVLLAQAPAAGASAREPAPTPAQPSAPASPLAAKAKGPPSGEMVCHPGAGTGRILGPPVCRTRDEWEVMVRNSTAGVNRGPDRSCRPGMMQGC